MKRPLLYKAITLAVLMLLLLIPIAMIDGVIEDRQALHLDVVHDIAKSSTYDQKLIGPILVLPFSKKVTQWRLDAKTNVRLQEEVVQHGQQVFLPEQFEFNGNLTTEIRSRGIYEARLYHADTELRGKFLMPKNFGLTDDLAAYSFAQPYLALGIQDVRGIENNLAVIVNGKPISMAPGSKLSPLGEGVHAMLPSLAGAEPQLLSFSLSLKLQGTESLQIIPVGKETRVNLRSDWPHPSFFGNQLPMHRSISTYGFEASWQTSYFASNIADSFDQCIKGECALFQAKSFGVSLIDPVDRYVKSDRAIKYALLFIALTFACFVLFEILKSLLVHPVQYGLVGLSLAFFYLLLVSLSEHLSFGLAYGISSLACIGLIGFYVGHVLQSFSRSIGFTLGLSLLYVLLYGLLSAEDYALLMGSILLFSVLGVFMIMTRKINWYDFGKDSRNF